MNPTSMERLGDQALTLWRFDLAKECSEKAGDLSAFILLSMTMADRDGLKLEAVGWES